MRKLALLAVLALAGCITVGPDYQRPAIGVPARYPAPAEPAGAQLPADWWKLYGDATLDRLVEAARSAGRRSGKPRF